jgi:hypothetical protein
MRLYLRLRVTTYHDAKRCEHRAGRADVQRVREAHDPASSLPDRGDEQGSMADRLVSRHAELSGQTSGRLDDLSTGHLVDKSGGRLIAWSTNARALGPQIVTANGSLHVLRDMSMKSFIEIAMSLHNDLLAEASPQPSRHL